MDKRFVRPRAKSLSIICLLGFAGAAAAGGTPVAWAVPADGLWSDPLNWIPSVVPGPSDDVLLGLTGPYTVLLGGQNQEAASLRIDNPLAQLHLTGGRRLRLNSTVVNDGTIVVNPGGTLTRPLLELTDGVAISGNGVIRLAAPGTFSELGGFLATDAAVQEHPHAIVGMGTISLGLTNRGSVIADVPGEQLRLNAASYVNEGVFAAIGGGTLRIGGVVDQSASGSVFADGPGSTVEIIANGFSGGSLGASDGGTVQLLNTLATSIHSARVSGQVRVRPGTTTTLTNVELDAADLVIDPPQPDPTVITLGSQTEWTAGSLALSQPAYRLQTVPGAEGVTLGTDVLLAGIGTIQIDATVHATLRADQAGQTLVLEQSDIVHRGAILASGGGAVRLVTSEIEHHGVIEATAGGSIIVMGCEIDRMPGSVVRAQGAGSVLHIETAITGGDLLALDGASIVFGNANNSASPVTLRDAVLMGDITLQSGTILNVSGSFVNNGTIRMTTKTSVGDDIQLVFADGVLLDGVGTIELGRDTEILPETPGAIVTLGAGQTIVGDGFISTGMVIEGVMRAETDEYLSFEGGPVTSRGAVVASGGTIGINTDYVQSFGSTLVAENDGTIQARGQIYGGVIEVEAGSRLQVWDAKLFDVTVNGDTSVRFRESVEIIDGFTNNGRLLLNESTTVGWSSLHFPQSTSIGGSGTILMSADHNRTRLTGGLGAVAEIGPDQRVEGSAITEVPLVIHGVLAPGIGVGVMYTQANLTLAPTATLEIDVSPIGTDQLITRGVDLGGTLEVRFVDGFSPASPYWERVFMLAAFGHTGEFDRIIGPDLPDPRLEYRVIFNDPQFRIATFCKADVNGDRQLNVFDLTEFVAMYNSADPAADLAAPFGTLNFFDIAAFVDRYNLGCP